MVKISKQVAHEQAGEVTYLQTINLSVKIALAPIAITDPMGAVRTQIDKLLFKYDDSIVGVPLSYQDIIFTPGKEYGRIYADHPWIYVEAEVLKMLVFSPSEGTVLQGRISQVSEYLHHNQHKTTKVPNCWLW